MGYIVILLLILIVFAVAGVFISRRFAPSKAQADLLEYYNLTAKESSERPAAGSNELAIMINDQILDSSDSKTFRAVKSGNDVFVGAALLQDYLDSRFYIDRNEGLLIFTDASESYMSYIGTSTIITSAGESDAGYVTAQEIEGEIYVNMQFAAAHTGISYKVLSDPARLQIDSQEGTVRYCTADTNIRMRTQNNKKSAIVTQVPKNARLKVLSENDGWLQVVDDNGYKGYVQSNFTGDITTDTVSFGFTEPEYTHILMDQPINMVWHGIYYYESNQYVQDYTANVTGVNVLAPTWFLFSDTYGNILTYADWDYVNYAHDNGYYVWAVLEDMDGESCEEIIPYTSRRQTAISQMIDTCLYYEIDGINVDLESVTTSIGNDFIQFIRELSVACRKNGLVLSVDDYAPYAYNAFRHTDEQSKICDYVAIMAYDDYVGTNEAGPNAGLPFFGEVLQLCANTVDMNRLIVGLPLYTRIWYENNDGSLSKDTREMRDIEDIVWNHGLTFEWQEDVGYDYAEYEENGARVRIWYENAKSLEAKLKLLSDYDVAGISSWRLGQETDDVWAVLEQYY